MYDSKTRLGHKRLDTRIDILFHHTELCSPSKDVPELTGLELRRTPGICQCNRCSQPHFTAQEGSLWPLQRVYAAYSSAQQKSRRWEYSNDVTQRISTRKFAVSQSGIVESDEQRRRFEMEEVVKFSYARVCVQLSTTFSLSYMATCAHL